MTKDKLVEGGEWEVDGTPPAAAPATAVPLTAGKPPESPAEAAAAVPSQLQEDADAAIRNYFGRHGMSIFPHQNTVVLDIVIEQILSGKISTRPITLRIPHRPSVLPIPQVRYLYNGPKLELTRQLVAAIEGKDLREMDMYNDDKFLEDAANLKELWPQIPVLYSSMGESPLLHPYVAVLGMSPERRALPVMALKKRGEFRPKDIEDLLIVVCTLGRDCLPITKEIIQLAKEYDVKEVLPVLDEIKNVEELYKAAWPL